MKKIYMTLAAVALGTAAMAQTLVNDSVAMGAKYADDVFYSMKNGEKKKDANSRWDLGFSMLPGGQQNLFSSIWANHDSIKVYSLHLDATNNWKTMTAADTTGKTSAANLLYNSDSTYLISAFNKNKDAGNVFDFGWGKYNQTTHNLVGDSIYLIKTKTRAYKIWIQSMNGVTNDWTFKIGQLDNSDTTTVTITKQPDFANRLFAYYDMETNAIVDREPAVSDWDIKFTRYNTLYTVMGQTAMSMVTGVTQNSGVLAAEAREVDLNTVDPDNYTLSPKLSAIGYDWKFQPDFTQPVYETRDSLCYFVKDKAGDLHYLRFTRFDGSATGKIVFEKKQIPAAPTSIKDVNSAVSNVTVYPNPSTAANVYVVVENKQAVKGAALQVVSMDGRVLKQTTVDLNAGLNPLQLNIGELASGMYLVTLKGDHIKVQERLVVNH
jgi:hypothetical protein